MKAKNSYSAMVVSTTAKGTIGIFAVIAAFISGFVVWSAAGVGGAIIQYIRN